MTWQEIVDRLGLEPHPYEGGYYRETYRAPARYRPGGTFEGDRPVSTAIYFLLTPDAFSAMHRLPGDEIYHHYLGDPVEMLLLQPDGSSQLVHLASDLEAGTPQQVVPGGVWQGSRLVEGGSFALLGTTMAPGFEFADFEAGSPGLVDAFPERGTMITDLLPPAG